MGVLFALHPCAGTHTLCAPVSVHGDKMDKMRLCVPLPWCVAKPFALDAMPRRLPLAACQHVIMRLSGPKPDVPVAPSPLHILRCPA